MAGRDWDAGEEGKGEEREGNSGAVLTYGGEGQLAGGREGLRCQRGGRKEEERERVYSPMADRAGFGRNPAGGGRLRSCFVVAILLPAGDLAAAASAGVGVLRDGEGGARGRRAERRGWGSEEGEGEVGAVSEGEERACGGVERGCGREQIGRG